LYHKTFSKIISLSGAFIIDNITDINSDHRDMIADYAYYRRIFGDLKQLKGSDKDPLYCVDQAISSGLVPAVYQAVGTEDFLLEENHNMRDALATRQICLDYHESSGIHDWQFWNTYLPKAIDWLLTE
ncbi:MAG: acetylesterase, partial [Lactococcus sp.]|nr:acetylesterase [Lactococcus sp.]